MKHVPYVKAFCFLLSLTPIAWLFYGAFTDRLGANPIEYIIRDLGTWALTFLLITLAITPLRRIMGWNWLLRLRRMFGLFAFFYVVLHFTSYIWWDQSLDWAEIWKDIVKRPFITVGFAAFLMLIPLAATSTNAMIKRLGARRWQLLHRLVYPIAMFGVLHYWWLVKRDVTKPLIYTLVLAALLAFRIVYKYVEDRNAGKRRMHPSNIA
jgi:sulfoxide reductase heme-binding subunit YedZ